ncbi:hypothetical protein [Nocardia sp. alder85J]|uniref:hypothetical protein n=1 Tax=Nocardia sp. alder85J TaxID=2862949 RepID=UPI001CD674AD|nr:hypothetical protein [Nocardia sp. alder85J]MCX4093049.1 hypothetical protein [Nocardia sp. alder85J]
MADHVEVDPVALNTASQVVQGVGDKIAAVFRSLNGGVDSQGEPWGDDSIGNQFANGTNGSNGYKTSKPNLLHAVDVMSQSFTDMAAAQSKAANDLIGQEQNNRDSF